MFHEKHPARLIIIKTEPFVGLANLGRGRKCSTKEFARKLVDRNTNNQRPASTGFNKGPLPAWFDGRTNRPLGRA